MTKKFQKTRSLLTSTLQAIPLLAIAITICLSATLSDAQTSTPTPTPIANPTPGVEATPTPTPPCTSPPNVDAKVVPGVGMVIIVTDGCDGSIKSTVIIPVLDGNVNVEFPVGNGSVSIDDPLGHPTYNGTFPIPGIDGTGTITYRPGTGWGGKVDFPIGGGSSTGTGYVEIYPGATGGRIGVGITW